MKAPFPYFGGKSTIADVVWQYLGQPDHYIEPCFGSGAVLLNRPGYDPTLHTETVNDSDGWVCNVWRAIRDSPDETAQVCDWPVNHADLMARKARLIREENYLLENLCKDDTWHDVELAGYWIWAASCWIGSGLTRPGQIPHLSDNGMGVHAVGKRPHLSDKGKGIHAAGKRNGIYAWFAELSARLRRVRVVCGDWSRVCGGDWQDKKWSTVGIFFDPPYASTDRDTGVYHHDGTDTARAIGEWCLERGARDKYRIVIAGYEDEYPALLDAGWSTEKWSAQGGYGRLARADTPTRGQLNRHRETLYVSPHCLAKTNVQPELFGLTQGD